MRLHPAALAMLVSVAAEVSVAGRRPRANNLDASSSVATSDTSAVQEQSEPIDDEHWSKAFAAILEHESLDHIDADDWKSHVATPAATENDDVATDNNVAADSKNNDADRSDLPHDTRRLWTWPGDGSREPVGGAGTNVAPKKDTKPGYDHYHKPGYMPTYKVFPWDYKRKKSGRNRDRKKDRKKERKKDDDDDWVPDEY